MKPQEVIQELNRQIDGRDDVIITTGVGQHQMFAAQFIEWHRPWSWVSSGGLGAWCQRCDACARLCLRPVWKGAPAAIFCVMTTTLRA